MPDQKAPTLAGTSENGGIPAEGSGRRGSERNIPFLLLLKMLSRVMAHYDNLVKKAVAEIRGRFVQRNLKQGLQGGREGKFVGSARQVESVDSFDLITWLVIK